MISGSLENSSSDGGCVGTAEPAFTLKLNVSTVFSTKISWQQAKVVTGQPVLALMWMTLVSGYMKMVLTPDSCNSQPVPKVVFLSDPGPIIVYPCQ